MLTVAEKFLKDAIHDKLVNGVVKVIFTKKDGTERVLICTLRQDLIDYEYDFSRKPRRRSDEVLAVWDLESKDWRSFRIDSVLSFAEHTGPTNLAELRKAVVEYCNSANFRDTTMALQMVLDDIDSVSAVNGA